MNMQMAARMTRGVCLRRLVPLTSYDMGNPFGKSRPNTTVGYGYDSIIDAKSKSMVMGRSNELQLLAYCLTVALKNGKASLDLLDAEVNRTGKRRHVAFWREECFIGFELL